MIFLFNLNVGNWFYHKILLEKNLQLYSFMELQQTIFNRTSIGHLLKQDGKEILEAFKTRMSWCKNFYKNIFLEDTPRVIILNIYFNISIYHKMVVLS